MGNGDEVEEGNERDEDVVEGKQREGQGPGREKGGRVQRKKRVEARVGK